MKIKLLKVTFDTEIAPYEIPAFRGAIVEKVGIEHEWFHNHDNDSNESFDARNKKVHYRYPLVQYKCERGRPCILFVEDGIEEARHFFSQPSWDLTFAGRRHKMPLAKMSMREVELGSSDGFNYYRVSRWLALNSKNVEVYYGLGSLRERVALLERVLTGNLISLCGGVNWHADKRFTVEITDVFRWRMLPFKGMKLMAFDVPFRTDLVLPYSLGIGKGVSKGFGVLSGGRGRFIQENKNEVNYGR